jgi:aspartyl-tRNA(Asn)/glutamyl-tRNA(Gln) amidotransferase subunit A
VAKAFENSSRLLRDMGCQLIEFDPLGIEAMPELTTSITQAEAAVYHERYRSQEHLYGSHFYERLLNGQKIKAMTYIAALQQQFELKEKWLEIANLFDVLVVPSGPAVAPPHGATTIEVNGEHFPFRDLTSRFSRPFNLLGWPALSVPNGVNSEGLPTGIQIAGPPESEERLMILGHHLEQSLGLITSLGIEPKYPI